MGQVEVSGFAFGNDVRGSSVTYGAKGRADVGLMDGLGVQFGHGQKCADLGGHQQTSASF